jgi:hypothetical protein
LRRPNWTKRIQAWKWSHESQVRNGKRAKKVGLIPLIYNNLPLTITIWDIGFVWIKLISNFMTRFKGVGCVGFGPCILGFIDMVCPNSKTNLGKHDEFYKLGFRGLGV